MQINQKTFPQFIIQPCNNQIPKNQRASALLLSIACGIFSLGLCQIVCAILLKCRKIVPQVENTRTQQLATTKFEKANKPSVGQRVEDSTKPSAKTSSASIQKLIKINPKIQKGRPAEESDSSNDLKADAAKARTHIQDIKASRKEKTLQDKPVKAKEDIAKIRAREEQWKLDFAQSMLQNWGQSNKKMTPQQIDQIVKDNASMIAGIVTKLKSGRKEAIEEIEQFASDSHVFKIKSIPNLIFKVSKFEKDEDNLFEKRFEFTRKAAELVQSKKYETLLVPACCYYEELGGQKVEMIVEECLPIAKTNFERQEELYEYCTKDPLLAQKLATGLADLTRFICEFGFSDVKFDNIPLTAYGIALVDLEHHFNAEGGLKSLVTGCLFSEQFEIVKAIVEKEYPNLFKRCNFTKWEQTRQDQLKQYSLIDKSLVERRTIIGNEPVYLQNEHLAGLNPADTEIAHLIVQIANKEVAKQQDLSLRGKRKITLSTGQLQFGSLGPQFSAALKRATGKNPYEAFQYVMKHLQQKGVFFGTEGADSNGSWTIYC